MRKYKYIIAIIEIIGISCFGIGLIRIGEYIYATSGAESIFVWKGNIGMAFSTALCIMFIGLALFLLGIYLYRDGHDK